MKTAFLVIFSLFSLFTTGSFAEEGVDNRGLRIKVEPELYPAQVYIDGGGDTGSKERSIVGIGEKMIISLEGKEQAIGAPDKIKWEIEGAGRELLVGSPQLTGKKNTIQVRNSISKAELENAGGSFTVKVVETEHGHLPEDLSITVVFPAKITAEHVDGGSLAPDYPRDGEARFGLSARAKMTLHPLTVNFRNINIIERDAKDTDRGLGRECQKPEDSGSLSVPHGANSGCGVMETNALEGVDHIGYKVEGDTSSAFKATDGKGGYVYKFPQNFHWICDFKVEESEETISLVRQDFHFALRDPAEPPMNVRANVIVMGKVEKFPFYSTEDKKDARTGNIGVKRQCGDGSREWGSHVFLPQK